MPNHMPKRASFCFLMCRLKGLSHEIDFDNIEKNWRMLALISAAAGFWFFQMHLWFLVEIKHPLSGKC